MHTEVYWATQFHKIKVFKFPYINMSQNMVRCEAVLEIMRTQGYIPWMLHAAQRECEKSIHHKAVIIKETSLEK